MSVRYRVLLQGLAVAVAAAALFWLLREHWRHALGYVAWAPYLLFLACPCRTSSCTVDMGDRTAART
jgi:hypothetical protein